MSDQATDSRSASGSAADRKTSVSTTAGVTLTAATLASTALWLMGDFKGHQFYQPDDALLLAWCAAAIPGIQWFARVFSLIGDIITRRLERDAAA